MKKVIIGLAILSTTVAISQVVKKQAAKKYHVEMTIEEWDGYLNNFEYVKSKLKNSDLPSKEVTLMSDSVLTKFQTTALTQLRQQLAADTTSKKK